MTWKTQLPAVRGKLLVDEALAPFTWFRVGGPADVVFLPADEQDLADFLKALDPAAPVLAIGVGSNLLVRDGGVDGVVIRLGKGFNTVEALGDNRIKAGSAVPDAILARKAADAGIAGLEFYAGIPGTVGGAAVMNAGCYGSETVNVIRSARVMDRQGNVREISGDQFDFTYRHSALQGADLIVLDAIFEGTADEPSEIKARMRAITERRETTQPIREKTGGSTFKNPPGHSSWKLVDEAGWRGRLYGGAMFSPLHSNFLINTGEATAADLEGLGDTVRADVLAKTGVQLEWEIKRIGRAE
ncbi:UDP-N-acetylmuramate dehydrogenase [Caulobacter rhizosphaerae]|jgi:UDP-N-acetylmuramate dehydrogenase|uniref:UDP-N-acetylenolpyruvoylglucosamine reductase n=1 Tax=Caulobacter rhizosphaerae TaxID=2010972 RepID=A0ABU1N6D6_9CAUL|nr:UDP-N-acetylmuramate dehydrogenase [Caulobacter rhizosphaerae]MDR6534020.1 UDP-N-acetylmuramate dehydrogenase [Caulobacter rhizosphaerae]